MLHKAILQTARDIEYIIAYMISKDVNMSKVAINIGANDGITLDPLHLLYLRQDYDGLCIEANVDMFNELKYNLPHKIKKVNTFVTPYNILNILKEFNNINIDIINIDIDSFDYCILEKIMTIEPKIIIIELNENIPPGITYYVKYMENYDYSPDGCYHLFGCSLDAVTELGKKYSYSLLTMEWNDAILVHNDFANLFEFAKSNLDAYDFGYYYRKNRKKIFYWKGQESKCRDMDLDKALDYLKNFFSKDLDKIYLEYTKDK